MGKRESEYSLAEFLAALGKVIKTDIETVQRALQNTPVTDAVGRAKLERTITLFQQIHCIIEE